MHNKSIHSMGTDPLSTWVYHPRQLAMRIQQSIAFNNECNMGNDADTTFAGKGCIHSR